MTTEETAQKIIDETQTLLATDADGSYIPQLVRNELGIELSEFLSCYDMTQEKKVISKIITETLSELYVRSKKRGGHPSNDIDEVLDALEKAIGKDGVQAVVKTMALKGFNMIK